MQNPTSKVAKVMQNPTSKVRQSFIVFEKLGILCGKSKNFTSSNNCRVEYFILKFCSHILITNVYKMVSGNFFYFI